MGGAVNFLGNACTGYVVYVRSSAGLLSDVGALVEGGFMLRAVRLINHFLRGHGCVWIVNHKTNTISSETLPRTQL